MAVKKKLFLPRILELFWLLLRFAKWKIFSKNAMGICFTDKNMNLYTFVASLKVKCAKARGRIA